MTWVDGDLLTPANLNSKGIGAIVLEAQKEGPLFVGTYICGKQRVKSSWTTGTIYIDLITAPTGQSLIWKVYYTRSGSDTLIGTVTITAGAVTGSTSASVALQDGDLVWDEITQVGSSNTGVGATRTLSAAP